MLTPRNRPSDSACCSFLSEHYGFAGRAARDRKEHQPSPRGLPKIISPSPLSRDTCGSLQSSTASLSEQLELEKSKVISLQAQLDVSRALCSHFLGNDHRMQESVQNTSAGTTVAATSPTRFVPDCWMGIASTFLCRYDVGPLNEALRGVACDDPYEEILRLKQVSVLNRDFTDRQFSMFRPCATRCLNRRILSQPNRTSRRLPLPSLHLSPLRCQVRIHRFSQALFLKTDALLFSDETGGTIATPPQNRRPSATRSISDIILKKKLFETKKSLAQTCFNHWERKFACFRRL